MGYFGRPYAFSQPDRENNSIGYFSNVYFASKEELLSLAENPNKDVEDTLEVFQDSNLVYNFMHTLETIEEM